jgi:predicted permease
MSLWSRIANAFRGDRLSREIDEEIRAHIAEAIEQGRDPAEARRAFGAALRTREECRDFRVLAWLDSLRADAAFAWRQFLKHKVTSAAAVLSLALAIGACTSAFRLIDALLLRPLPVAAPEQLYAVVRQGSDLVDDKATTYAEWPYPSFRLMRDAVKGQAELLGIAIAERKDLTYRSDAEMEKSNVQYVSGWMFDSLGLRPAAGRLFTENDDLKPGAHPYAVLSYDYWQRRFAQDPKAVGRTFQLGESLFQIVGVGPAPFTGTEPGTVTDIFLPTMMHPGVTRDDWTWMRTLARVRPGIALEPLRAKLDAVSYAFEKERSKGFTDETPESIERFLKQRVMLEPAAAGASGLQQTYRTALAAMGVLVALVLLIACANVANLMTAQAAARVREMALRVSIGAGRARLVQLVLVESAWLAMASAALGACLAWWSAPFVVSRINPPDNPARLILPADWRVLAFGAALTLGVTLLFGLAPALRASKVNPASALRGGSSNPHARRRLMHALIAVQVTFCFVVLFVAGLFAATFDHLSHFPLGFAADRLLTVETVASSKQPAVFWNEEADRLRAVPGVESVALAGWALLDDNSWNNFVSVNGAPLSPILAYFLEVSPGWIGTMKIALLDGHDFRTSDATPGAAIVNETFVKQFLHGASPIGMPFAAHDQSYRVVGVVRDSPYRRLREPILPVAYVPFQPTRRATIMIRTRSANPLAVASILRHEVTRARVTNVGTQLDLIQAQTVRERQAGDIAWRVTAEVFRVVALGALAGLGLGMVSVRYITALLYQVRPSDPTMLAMPSVILVGTALIAALPAVIHAVRIDPVAMLRAD